MAKKKKKRREKPVPLSKKIYNVFSVVAALLPWLGFTLFLVFYPIPDSEAGSFLFLGIAGSIMVTIPIYGFLQEKSLLVKDKEQKKTMVWPLVLFVLSVLFIAVSIAVVLIPKLYNNVNGDAAAFYFVGVLFLLFFAILYGLLRGSIDTGLRYDGHSNSAIKKLKEGRKNYWWYEAIHKEYGLGMLYHCNKYFTISFILGAGVHLTLGWWTPFAWFSTVMFCVMGITLSVLSSYASSVLYKKFSEKHYEAEYGKMRTRAKKHSAAEGVVMYPVFILFLCYIMINLALNL